VDGIPDAQAWNDAIGSNLAKCEENGATIIDSRVITANEGVDEALVAARAAMHRDELIARGFKQGEGRVEYHMALEEALLALDAKKISTRLVWSCVNPDSETELALAAGLFRQAAEGDPASHPGADALGFLKTLLEDEDTLVAPERVQIGTCKGVPAAVLALMAYPSDGWSTIYYLGVMPDFRGRGFGREAMLQGLRCLKAMGGKIYHDGTGSRNAGARALFARLGRPPFRIMEEWRLKK
jgi:ribosomal protein S18 acetylase RimI-like enzyme